MIHTWQGIWQKRGWQVRLFSTLLHTPYPIPTSRPNVESFYISSSSLVSLCVERGSPPAFIAWIGRFPWEFHMETSWTALGSVWESFSPKLSVPITHPGTAFEGETAMWTLGLILKVFRGVMPVCSTKWTLFLCDTWWDLLCLSSMFVCVSSCFSCVGAFK